jgi:hypothetical protein
VTDEGHAVNIAMTVPAVSLRFEGRPLVVVAINSIATEAINTWTTGCFCSKTFEKCASGTIFVRCTNLGVQPTLGWCVPPLRRY